MPGFPQLRTKLQEKLSLSTKLSLKVFIARSAKFARAVVRVPVDFLQRAAGAAAAKGIPVPKSWQGKVHRFDPPTLSGADLVNAAQKIATAASARRGSVVSIKTSIVIPVFNKAAFTWQCLCSLMNEIDLSETEIIVADDASTDETSEVLTAMGDVLRVVTNKENKGFVDACNRGAALAQGEYLVFLNNDTEVLPGWLKHLIETVRSDASVGAVGSMFLYPDGSIQEAGAIVWKNGEAHHYGWSGSPDDRRFNFAREVDYCSAASLLIRKEIFEQLGGFDRRFAPAYYEDVDLCFGVRSLGHKVIYQPMSRVVHYEGVTAGRDTASGVKHFQIVNREKFVAKWGAVLAEEHLEKNLKRLADAADRNHARPRTIVFDERIPSPDRDAGSARMFMILKTLAKWGHVVFVPFNRPHGVEYEQALWKIGIETAQIENYVSLLRNKNTRVAIVSRPSVAEALIPRIRRVNREVKILFDMVDAHFIRLEREHEISGDARFAEQAKRYRKIETQLARASDLVWCNSSADKCAIEPEIGGEKIDVVPTIHELHGRGEPFEIRRNLLFVGNLAHRPNEDGLHFFMREVFPRIQLALPDAKLFIVGDNAPATISGYDSEQVRVLGYVPDITSYWRGCRVFIAPLRFGAGTKGKIGDALSYGLPVVTSSVGAESTGLIHETHVMIADAPEEFAEAVIRLYRDRELWDRLSQHGYEHIRANFTPEAIERGLSPSLSRLGLIRQPGAN